MQKLTKAQLAATIAKKTGITRIDALKVSETVTGEIIESLLRGEKVELRGFGSFRVRERNARIGRNPKTGEPVQVPAKRIPYFKPGRLIRESLPVGRGE